MRAALSALGVVLVLAALPSAAAAQQANPDSYLYRYHINDPNTPLATSNGPFGGTTVGRGEQLDLFDPPSFGGIDENIGCSAQAIVWYGATEWWRFHPHRNGLVAVGIQGSGFTPVMAIMRVSGDGNPNEDFDTSFRCFTGDPVTNNVTAVYPLNVSAGTTYAIQVGGTRTPNTSVGTPGTGVYSLSLGYDPDTDGDGFLDSSDRCISDSGISAHGGCPDADGDGFPEGSAGTDACPGVKGLADYRGCPDADGDKFPENGSDKCPGRKGLKYAGCPDADRDRVPEDGSDECPKRSALRPARGLIRNDRNGDGCPDTLRLHNRITVDKSVDDTSSGIVLQHLTIKGVPNGSRVTCRVGRRHCPKTPFRATTSSLPALAAARNTKLLGNRSLRFGTKIEVKVKAAYANTFVYRFRVIREGGLGWYKQTCLSRIRGKLRPKDCR